MASSTIIPVVYTQARSNKNHSGSAISPSKRYSIQDHGRGYRTYSYEFDLADYEAEQITVLLDDNGTLRIRAYRPPCREFRREYNLGGTDVEATLVRNTIDSRGRLRVDIDIRPRRDDLQSVNNNNNTLTFDLQGYRPENVTVRINRHGLLKINGQYIDTALENHINREYYRQYQLPSNVNPDLVRARMDENQLLTIELPQPSSTTNYTQREYWVPVYERNHPPFYGAGPNGAYCCCNLM
jgi:HSP20 family molecular chaperone IbpA